MALVVPDETALWQLAHALTRAHVEFCPIVESDPPFAGQLMALGVAPRRKEELRRHLSALALLT